MRRIIEQAWNEFELIVLPKTAGPDERAEARRAFFCGVAVMHISVQRSEVQESTADMMLSVAKEVNVYTAAELELSEEPPFVEFLRRRY